MCIAELGGLLGGVLAARAQNRYQTEAAEAQNRIVEENARIANQAYLDKASIANLRLQEENEAISNQLMQENLADRQGQAMTVAQAAETGARGLSLKSLLAGYDRNSAMNNYIAGRNMDMKYRQTQQEIKGYQSEAQGRINSVTPYVPSYQSVGAAVLQGVSQGISTGLNVYSKTKAKEKNGR